MLALHLVTITVIVTIVTALIPGPGQTQLLPTMLPVRPRTYLPWPPALLASHAQQVPGAHLQHHIQPSTIPSHRTQAHPYHLLAGLEAHSEERLAEERLAEERLADERLAQEVAESAARYHARMGNEPWRSHRRARSHPCRLVEERRLVEDRREVLCTEPLHGSPEGGRPQTECPFCVRQAPLHISQNSTITLEVTRIIILQARDKNRNTNQYGVPVTMLPWGFTRVVVMKPCDKSSCRIVWLV